MLEEESKAGSLSPSTFWSLAQRVLGCSHSLITARCPQHLHCPASVLQLSPSSAPHSIYPDVQSERALRSCPQPNYQCKTCASKIGLASLVLIPTLRTTRGPSRHHFWPTAPPPSSMTRSCAHTHSGSQIFARTIVQLEAIALARAQHVPSRDHHCRQLGWFLRSVVFLSMIICGCTPLASSG